MFATKRGSFKEHKGLFSRSADAGQAEIVIKFFPYPAQESRRGMFMFIAR